MEKEKQEEVKKMRNEMKGKARQDSRQEIAVQAQKIQVHEEDVKGKRKEWEKGRRTRTEWHLKVSLMGCWTAGKGGCPADGWGKAKSDTEVLKATSRVQAIKCQQMFDKLFFSFSALSKQLKLTVEKEAKYTKAKTP